MERNNHSEPFVFLFGRNLLHRQLTDKTKTYRKKGLPDDQPRKDVLKCSELAFQKEVFQILL